MISCIICSRNKDISKKLRENLSSTIGCEHEVIIIDNSQCTHTMSTAYNLGAKLAQGDLLCFMHEDILYHNTNWGTRIAQRFQDSKLGLVGVLGSHFLPNCVCNVGDSGLLSSNYYTKDKCQYLLREKYFDNTGAVDVVVVDGMWFVIRKSLFDDGYISFDETYPGFHYYDMDICLQIINAGYNCKVVNDVLLEHFSNGDIDHVFLQNSFKFYNKWKNILPIVKGVNFNTELLELSAELASINAYVRELEYYNHKLRNNILYRVYRFIKSKFHIIYKNV